MLGTVAIVMYYLGHKASKSQVLQARLALDAYKKEKEELLVFLTATALMWWSDLDPETWGMIAIMYISGQSVIDAVKAWKWGGQ